MKRLGGFFLPFDLGVKFGFLPEAVNQMLPAFDFLNLWRIEKESI